ncbi:hypothetical protein [Vibrio sp. FF145]|uniref:hypothetical protein n=1 Tax=Vibrio sp. FF145 TaxID=3230013 RepID=UPI00352EDB5C
MSKSISHGGGNLGVIANRWAGRIYGTNTGNVFLEVSQDQNSLTGKLRIMDTIYGISMYDCTGTYDDGFRLECTPISAPEEGVVMGNVVVIGKLTQSGNIKGDWSSTIGTAGTFELYPHDTINENPTNNPEQIYNRAISVGSIRLFKDDLEELINFLRKDFKTGRVVITYKLHGSELTKYADDFLSEKVNAEQLNYFKLVIQEPEAHGINRTVVIELNETGSSEIRVSGINESWVLGKSASLEQVVLVKQNRLVTTYRKYGLNLNAIIFGVMLVAIPEIPEWENRTIFVIVMFALLNALLYLHTKFIPNTAVYLGQSKPTVVQRVWPTVLSWVIAATSSFAAAYAFSLLK